MADHLIKTPIPGVFYGRPSPEAPAYVEPGATVKVGDTVGLVELMKSFHPVTSDVDGVVEAVLVEDNAEVSPGQDIVSVVV
ncbi:MAG: acetyl-CoA carboxylase [Rhodococcus sp. (in: high G+C Gram-positive bacteria)]